MHTAFSNCNLTITNEGLSQVLRQGVNLIGAGLLDMIKKRSGLPDNASVLGFVGMLLAARKVRSEDPHALVASVDGRIARLWLKLGPAGGGKRCDLIAVRRAGDGLFRLTCIEVKTTGEAALPDEAALVGHAADQIEQTADVLANAFGGAGPFAAPRSEMLKEVLVRAASNRWGADDDDVAQRKIWGPMLKDLFGDSIESPIVRVDGEIVVVKLRSTEHERVTPLGGRKIPISVRTITERAAEELFGNEFVTRAAPESAGSDGADEASDDSRDKRPVPPAKESASPADEVAETEPDPPAGGKAERAADVRSKDDARPSSSDAAATMSSSSGAGAGSVSAALDRANEADAVVGMDSGAVWPPRVNALGMIGQHEVAQELHNQARKAKGLGREVPRQAVRRAGRCRQDNARSADCRAVASTGTDHIQRGRSSPTGDDRRSSGGGRQAADGPDRGRRRRPMSDLYRRGACAREPSVDGVAQRPGRAAQHHDRQRRVQFRRGGVSSRNYGSGQALGGVSEPSRQDRPAVLHAR